MKAIELYEQRAGLGEIISMVTYLLISTKHNRDVQIEKINTNSFYLIEADPVYSQRFPDNSPMILDKFKVTISDWDKPHPRFVDMYKLGYYVPTHRDMDFYDGPADNVQVFPGFFPGFQTLGYDDFAAYLIDRVTGKISKNIQQYNMHWDVSRAPKNSVILYSFDSTFSHREFEKRYGIHSRIPKDFYSSWEIHFEKIDEY